MLEPWLSADVAYNTAPTPNPGMDTVLPALWPVCAFRVPLVSPYVLFLLPKFLPAVLAWHLASSTAGATALLSLPGTSVRSCASGPPDSLALPSPSPAGHSGGSSRSRR